jgi:hypothetical protein|tara:strand:+ start:97 stop:387 length:291 start_codon:yes stop_codon:yes gene_type:complete
VQKKEWYLGERTAERDKAYEEKDRELKKAWAEKDEALKKKEEELKAQLKNKGALFPYSTLVLVSVRLRTPRRRLSTPLLTPLKSPHPIHPERRPCF